MFCNSSTCLFVLFILFCHTISFRYPLIFHPFIFNQNENHDRRTDEETIDKVAKDINVDDVWGVMEDATANVAEAELGYKQKTQKHN